jgi:hypothetical protein
LRTTSAVSGRFFSPADATDLRADVVADVPQHAFVLIAQVAT